MDRLLAALILPGLLPWAAITALHPRLRRDWAERWGLRVTTVQPGAIWLHGASVGEVGAAEALLGHLPRPVLITADTDTGAARARAIALRHAGVAAGVRPVDHAVALAPLWAEARPRAVVFLEGTFWPGLAWRARRAGIPVVRAGAKAGRRTRVLVPLVRAWWWPTDQVLARDEKEAAWLRQAQRAPVVVCGDPKADRAVPSPVLTWPGPFVVGASTRAGDEALLLAALAARRSRPGLLLAPRHRARFVAVADLLEASGVQWLRRSALRGGRVPPGTEVVLLDTVGELAGCLQGATAVFVGGTYDPQIGGHAPFEAAAAGVPIIAGPHVDGQGSAFADVGALLVSRDGLAAALAAPPAPAWSVGGAADRVGVALRGVLGLPAPEASPRPWAAPLAAVWRLGARTRNGSYDAHLRRVTRVGVPVISVGSTNARSPGRTSTVRALVAVLRTAGHRVGVATRGYRRAHGGRGLRTSVQSMSAADLGDEGALLAAAGALVAAGPDRVAGARALQLLGASVVLLDDGLQHRRLHRDLDIAVVDARYPGARGMLPAGEAREPGPAPARADLVLVHHGSALFTTAGHAVTRRPGPWSRPGVPPGGVAAFCGIGRAADFLASLDVPVAAFLVLPDHAVPDPAHLAGWSAGRPLVCTAKDAVRLPEVLRQRAWWRDIDLVLPPALYEALRPYTSGSAGSPDTRPDPDDPDTRR